jgi:hypothetical protein
MVIVAYECKQKTPHFDDCLASGVEASVDYEGMTIQYSGWNGVDGKKGHEFVKIDGKLTQPLTIKAFAFKAGTATVNYSWGPKADTAPATPATPSSSTPDPASYCGPSNVAWDGGINMCIVDPAFTAAKDQCDSDLSSATAGKTTCESNLSSANAAKATCDSDLSSATAAKTTCDVNLSGATTVLTAAMAAKATCDSDLSSANAVKATCDSDLSSATAAKATCESSKITAESDLATCQFDLTASQATAATGNSVLDPKTHWLSKNSSFELLKAGHDCTSSDSKIGVVNTVAECAALCGKTSGCEVFIFEHTSGTPAKCWAESTTKTNCTWKSGPWDAYGLVPAPTYTFTLLSECSSDQFESVASTLTSDRECSNITQCTSNQYQLTAPTATSDRVCNEQIVCAVYEDMAVAGTATSAQVCESKCTETEWFDVSTAECNPLTECVGDEVQEVAPSPTSDRVCGTSCMCDVATGKLVGECPNELTGDTILENEDEGVYLTTTQERICMALSPYYYKSGEKKLMWSGWLEYLKNGKGYVQYPDNGGSLVYNSYIYHTGDMGFWEPVPVLVNWLNDRGVGIIGTPGEGF